MRTTQGAGIPPAGAQPGVEIRDRTVAQPGVCARFCDYCKDPEMGAIRDNAKRNNRNIDVFGWHPGSQTYLGQNNRNLALPVIEDMVRNPLKSPTHPDNCKFLMFILGFTVLLLVFLIIGSNAVSENQQVVFFIFWMFIVLLFVFCVLARISYKLKDYQFRRLEEMMNIFRRHETPGIRFRLAMRGFVLVMETTPQQFEVPLVPGQGTELQKMKTVDHDSPQGPPGYGQQQERKGLQALGEKTTPAGGAKLDNLKNEDLDESGVQEKDVNKYKDLENNDF